MLAGCASGPVLVTLRLASTPPYQHAYLLGTYAVSCEPRSGRCDQVFNALSVYSRDSTDNAAQRRPSSVSGSIFSDDTNFDFVDMVRKEKGFYFCIALPPSDYHVYKYGFYNFAGGGSGFSIPKANHFNVPFKLAHGEVPDVGRLKLTTDFGKNIFGMTLPAPGVLLLSDEPASTRQLALAKCSANVQQKPIRLAPLNVDAAKGSPLVQAAPGR